MQIILKILPLPFFLLLILLLSGCSTNRERAGIGTLSESPSNWQDSSVARRFQAPESHGQTAVDSAIQLSQKYAKLSEDVVALRGQNQELLAENNRLKEQITDLDAKLKQAQKELTESNDLLIEMRIELNNWKTDVLGFRDEMREAETAQLEALLQILKILGGESIAESSHNANGNSVAVSVQGEPNE
jgi:predicted RNase H-like nuclease (RuvC/YqgF family)